MSTVEVLLLLCSLACVAAFWLVPGGQNAVVAVTAVSLLFVAPLTFGWLVGSVILTPLVMRLGQKLGLRGLTVLCWSAIYAGIFLAARETESTSVRGVVLIGGAYFTLRHIHVMMEWWLGRLQIPKLGAYARYHLFLPVLASGPIHRLPHFERQCERRRFSAEEFYLGAERALFGLVRAVAIGGFLFTELHNALIPGLEGITPFFSKWILSALDWVQLYIRFSGLTDIALGFSLMMGLRLEENFNRPWMARNLTDFWTRWHMTLSHWCRDYIYVPIAAHFRAPAAGVVAAMLVIGLWHDTSVYYIFWSFWQAIGIIATHLYARVGDCVRFGTFPDRMKSILGPVAVLAWLSATRPVFDMLQEVLG
jgi:alginate O-acetyltransferase complex protein AlgI